MEELARLGDGALLAIGGADDAQPMDVDEDFLTRTNGFYDKNGKTSYNCLPAIDFRGKFRCIGVFSGSNSDQSMWNQSEVLGLRARYLCPPGINWLADAGFKIWPFLMVPFDERRGKRLSRKQLRDSDIPTISSASFFSVTEKTR
ncbi:hypothetical protein AM587_10002155 [Phytophthora nicotianae]|uniref:DDE Tnp4 domain-containing protein n=1 Tax=Phytophthora nicotianae TaxID=4792 RepID=A0A0W8CUZ3_PHYNI|nr:hypothetical protein AM587_10002155 [Phytophthora nicotianae]